MDHVMFQEMRRSDRSVSEAEARDILTRAEYGVLATVGSDGWPYAVPLNHVLVGDVLYLHCASKGHKLENIAHEERVSYCAVAAAQIAPSLPSTFYESAVVFGRASQVTDEGEKRQALLALVRRLCGDSVAEKIVDGCSARPSLLRIRIERITGKAHRA